jgi:hypothetical protein
VPGFFVSSLPWYSDCKLFQLSITHKRVLTVVKFSRSLSMAALFSLGVAGLFAQETQPVFVYLYGRYSDFVNIELTEGRIRDTISVIEKYRKEYPQARASVTMLF